jgi:hypothetical protein
VFHADSWHSKKFEKTLQAVMNPLIIALTLFSATIKTSISLLFDPFFFHIEEDSSTDVIFLYYRGSGNDVIRITKEYFSGTVEV